MGNYKDLHAWKKSMRLAKSVYFATKGFPKDELYGLTSQMRRAAVSIPSNIAEGQGRLSRGEFKQFLGVARGSLLELGTQIELAKDVGLLSDGQAVALIIEVDEAGRVLNGLLSSIREPVPPSPLRTSN